MGNNDEEDNRLKITDFDKHFGSLGRALNTFLYGLQQNLLASLRQIVVLLDEFFMLYKMLNFLCFKKCLSRKW